MKPDLPATDLLLSVIPTNVEDYLRRAGWTERRRQDDFASMWTRHDDASGRELKVLVPLDPELGDYASRVADVLRVLETAERRSPDEILSTLRRTQQSDVFEISVERDDIVNGLIPLTAGAKIFQGTRDIFLAAAAAEHEPHAVLSPRQLTLEARQALRQTFLAQTREGSYVVSVVARMPLPPRGPRQHDLPLSEPAPVAIPMQRRVFRRVAVALEAARKAAEEDTADAFAKRIELGVSWNLCRAIAKLGSGRHFRQVSFTPKWGDAIRPPSEVPQHIVFHPKMINAIREGAAALKQIRPKENFLLEGKVVELRDLSERRDEATVVVEGSIDATSVRRVSMELRGEDVRTAHEAWLSQRMVRCVGTLMLGVQVHRLLSVKRFEVAVR